MAAPGRHSSVLRKQHILFMDEYVSCKDLDLSLMQKGVMSSIHVWCVCVYSRGTITILGACWRGGMEL